MQQSEQEVKSNSVESSDQKTVPGQFDSLQNDQTESIKKKEENLSIITSSNVGNEESVTNKNIDDVKPSVEITAVKTDNKMEDTVVGKETTKKTIDDSKCVITSKSIKLDIDKTDGEPPKIETTVPENSVVEEAVA